MAEKFLMKNETTGQMKPTYLGFSWTMLIFNIFAPLFRGDFRTFFVLVCLNLAVSLISPNMIFWACVSFMPGFIYSFFWNKEYTKRLFEKGFVFAEDENKNAYALTKYNTPNKGGYIFCAIYCILSLLFAFQFVGGEPSSILEISDFVPFQSANKSPNASGLSEHSSSQSKMMAGAENFPQVSKKPIIFHRCSVEENIPVICGEIPFKGYKTGECISALMSDDFESICKKMKKGNKYYFEYMIYNEDIDGEPTEPYENVTKIYLK